MRKIVGILTIAAFLFFANTVSAQNRHRRRMPKPSTRGVSFENSHGAEVPAQNKHHRRHHHRRYHHRRHHR